MIRAYLNLDLRISGYQQHPGEERFEVQVEDSPAGEQRRGEPVVLTAGGRQRLQQVHTRACTGEAALIGVGVEVGRLLFPPGCRDLLGVSLGKLAPEDGLRIRIKCENSQLDSVPWELAHVDVVGELEGGAAADARGFLVWNTRISVVRYVLHARLVSPTPRAAGRRRVVTVMCEPDDLRNPAAGPLQLDAELARLREVMAPHADSTELLHCDPPTRTRLREVLLDGADVFHFSGHGGFEAESANLEARGHLVLQTDECASDRWPADMLAARLASKGIQLAYLGACHSAVGGVCNPWAGVAPSLVRAGIPAVIGMHHDVYDDSARVFSETFYGVWLAGRSIDEAVAEARSAVFDRGGELDRDFATPVLYLRAERDRTGPVAADVNAVLDRIATLYDYKLVHEALHKAQKADVVHLELCSLEFPGGNTLQAFAWHRDSLRTQLAAIEAIRKRERCDASMLRGIAGEFEVALKLLDEAIAHQASGTLNVALAAFGTLLSMQPPRIAGCMVTIAGALDMTALIAFLRSAGERAGDRQAAWNQTADELQILGEQLGAGAALHGLCQGIDAKLTLIKGQIDRFNELCRQWMLLDLALRKLPTNGTLYTSDRLLEHARNLGVKVIAVEKADACKVFDNLCADFDFGFYAVDEDFKKLCHNVQSKAELARAA